MPIQVTCPGCLARFSVSDKYAGRKGPCPKCKKEIVVPDKSQEVVIHAPEDSGPKDAKGVSVLKPLRRKDFHVNNLTWILSGVGILVVLVTAIVVRVSVETVPALLLVIGAIVLAPPMVMMGYTFLHDDELEGYDGQEYLVRSAICSVVFALTWAVYYGLARYFEYPNLSELPATFMGVFLAVMMAIGTFTSLATFELETIQAATHYIAYLAVTIFLCLIMGVELGEPLAAPKSKNAIGVNRPTPTVPVAPK